MRVIEFSGKVRVIVEGDAEGTQTILSNEASVRIVADRVLCLKSSDDVVMEVCIADLAELTADDKVGSLTFTLQRQPGETQLVSLTIGDPRVRSAMYKVVCAKRSMLETRGGQ